MTDGYFSDMSMIDWLGVVLMAPFLVAMALLIVYFTIGVLGSRRRLRKIAIEKAAANGDLTPAKARRASVAARQAGEAVAS